MQTGAEIGYEEAMRQVSRALTHRLKSLEETYEEEADSQEKLQTHYRIEEVKHLLDVLKSLHR